MQWNLPNILTALRIALIPVVVLCFYLPFTWSNVAAAIVFLLASVTDWLDGFLARKMRLTSRFGAFLDPVADKLMVATVLVLIVQRHPNVSMVLPAMIIIGREITISALREWMAEIGSRAQVKVALIGKIKTVVQMAALAMLLYEERLWDLPMLTLGYIALLLAAGMTLWSMALYLRAAGPAFKAPD